MCNIWLLNIWPLTVTLTLQTVFNKCLPSIIQFQHSVLTWVSPTRAPRRTPCGWRWWRHPTRRQTATSWARAPHTARSRSGRRYACPPPRTSPHAHSCNTQCQILLYIKYIKYYLGIHIYNTNCKKSFLCPLQQMTPHEHSCNTRHDIHCQILLSDSHLL